MESKSRANGDQERTVTRLYIAMSQDRVGVVKGREPVTYLHEEIQNNMIRKFLTQSGLGQQ